MKYFATFDENGHRTASYVDSIHTDIPEDAIEISDEDQALYATNRYFRNANGNPELIPVVEFIPIPSERRKTEYATRRCIAWENDTLTIDAANLLYAAYLAEGDTGKAAAIQSLIVEQKTAIRAEIPDSAL